MDKDVRIFLAAPPESVSAAAGTGLNVAYMIYRIGRGYHLFRAERARTLGGGLMVLDTDGYGGGGPAAALMAEIMGECRRQGFEGIVLDIGGLPEKPLFPLAGELGAEAVKNGLRLYVPEKMAASSRTPSCSPHGAFGRDVARASRLCAGALRRGARGFRGRARPNGFHAAGGERHRPGADARGVFHLAGVAPSEVVFLGGALRALLYISG